MMATAHPGDESPFLRWDQYRKPERTRQPLSREAIVNAALKVVDEQGLAALSMRAVAQLLGTGPASLYAHVANKEQLIDLVLDRVYGEFEIPEPDQDRWQEQIKTFARSARRVLLAHRGLAAAMLGTSPLGPNGLRLVEGTLALARAAELPDAIAAYTGELLGRYIAVTVLEQESNRERFGAAGREEIQGWIGEYRRYLENLPAGQFPNLVQIARSGQMMLPGTGEERFELGLDILVGGLASFLALPGE
jgi:TetR/AcrR family transcriptional regulator, tetracycline repressor protein